MARKYQFNPAAAAQTARDSKQEELDALDKEINSLLGSVIAPIQAAFDATQADDKAPVDVQIQDGKKLRDTLKAMQAAMAGTSSLLSPDEQKLVDLLRNGTLSFDSIKTNDETNPGQKVTVEVVKDKRWPSNPRNKTSTSAQPTAPTTAPAPGNPAPAPTSPAPAPTAPAQGTPAAPVQTPTTSLVGQVFGWIKQH